MSAKPDLKVPEPPETDMVTIEVNGRPLKARKGSMVIQVTDAAGIYIPRFCYHHKLSVAARPTAACVWSRSRRRQSRCPPVPHRLLKA